MCDAPRGRRTRRAYAWGWEGGHEDRVEEREEGERMSGRGREEGRGRRVKINGDVGRRGEKGGRMKIEWKKRGKREKEKEGKR